ncbi:MAG: LamG domain-containing protein, partial [Candidatus Aenigmarchaeota archaeon]|nr:LamG domain-containing protein [Candidatus Aenigmarchaeota archaeon]
WHHLAGVFDSQTNTLKMYVDGVQDGSAQTTSGTLLTSTQPVSIGSAEPNYVSTEYFNGTIDDVRIYNRALNASEIQALYHSGSCIHRSDSNCDGCVSDPELTAFIDKWKVNSQDVILRELIESIGLWKRGGC